MGQREARAGKISPSRPLRRRVRSQAYRVCRRSLGYAKINPLLHRHQNQYHLSHHCLLSIYLTATAMLIYHPPSPKNPNKRVQKPNSVTHRPTGRVGSFFMSNLRICCLVLGGLRMELLILGNSFGHYDFLMTLTISINGTVSTTNIRT